MTSQRTSTGYSGQMAVMSEVLFRKCNAAVPVIDDGMDVFAFLDEREDVARIQVKAAKGVRYKKSGGYRAQFNVPMKQLKAIDEPPLYYALAVRLEQNWESFVVISRRQLRLYWDDGVGVENPASGELALNLQYRPNPDEPTKLSGVRQRRIGQPP